MYGIRVGFAERFQPYPPTAAFFFYCKLLSFLKSLPLSFYFTMMHSFFQMAVFAGFFSFFACGLSGSALRKRTETERASKKPSRQAP
jgi:amino acid transporter